MESDHEWMDTERVVPPVPTVTEIRTLSVNFPSERPRYTLIRF